MAVRNCSTHMDSFCGTIIHQMYAYLNIYIYSILNMVCIIVSYVIIKHTRSATNWTCSRQPTPHSLRMDSTWESIGFSYFLSAETSQCLRYLKEIGRQRPRFANDAPIKHGPEFRYMLYISSCLMVILPLAQAQPYCYAVVSHCYNPICLAITCNDRGPQ